MGTTSALEKELAALRAKQGEIEAELQRKEEMARTNPLADLAEALHEKFCHWNHTDGCGWFYEQWPGPNGGTRQSWIARAQKVQAVMQRHALGRKGLDELLEALGDEP